MHKSEERLLIVDDDPNFRSGFERALSRLTGWTIESVDTSRAAIDRWRRNDFDVLLIDKNLKGESGVDLVDEIRKSDPFVAIVMITGYGSIENAKEMLHLGVDRYVEKPVEDFNELVRALRILIEKSRHRRASADGGVIPSNSLPAPRMIDPEAEYSVMIVSPLSSEREWIARQFDPAFRLRQASSSAEAMGIIEKSPQDIVVVDTAVRQPDVFDFVQQINETVVGTDIVVISHILSMEEIKRFIDLDVAALMEKPLSEELFRQKIERLLAKNSHDTMARVS